MIKDYAKKGRIVVITGTYHLRNGSPLMKNLSSFLAIYPEYKGKMIFGPVREKKKVRYGFRICL